MLPASCSATNDGFFSAPWAGDRSKRCAIPAAIPRNKFQLLQIIFLARLSPLSGLILRLGRFIRGALHAEGVIKRDRLAVAAQRCNRTPTRGGRAADPGATVGVTGFFGGTAANSVPNGQALSSKAVGRKHSATRGPCGGKPQTPRAGRWRESGLAVAATRRRSWPGSSSAASVRRRIEARPLDPRASRAPSDCFGSASAASLGQNAPRECGCAP